MCVVEDSAFSRVYNRLDTEFRLFNQFAVFTYSQLQNILLDSTLGNISDWDSFLTLDLDSTELPFKTADQFILNENYHRLVLASRLPRPGKFIEQSVSFCKAFCCKQLMTHDIVRSDLLRGLSAFDSSVILESPGDVYVAAIEKLSTHFGAVGLISSSDKIKAVCQYRSFVSILRSGTALNYDDLIQFLVTHYEVQCRPESPFLFERTSCHTSRKNRRY